MNMTTTTKPKEKEKVKAPTKPGLPDRNPKVSPAIKPKA
jgi:hypothetical protein